jgi:hypothetical protein
VRVLYEKGISDVCDTLLYLYNGPVHLLGFPHQLSKFYPAFSSSWYPIQDAFYKGIAPERVAIGFFLRTPELFQAVLLLTKMTNQARYTWS